MVVTFTAIGVNMIPSRDKFRCYIATNYEKFGCQSRYVGKGNGRGIHLPHNTKYGIGVENLSKYRCTADIEIDGKSVGDFYIPSGKTMFLKRGEKEDRCFVFISSESDIAGHLKIPKSNEKGEIRIRIRPEEVKFGYLRTKLIEVDGCGSFPAGSVSGSYDTACAGSSENSVYASDYGIASTESCRHSTAVPTTLCSDVVDSAERTGCKGGLKVESDGISRSGLTVLREPTGQTINYVPTFPTRGHHDFFFQLLLGNPSGNIIYNGFNDDNGERFDSTFNYKAL